MDIRKVHILIEQGLQQVGVFAYDDIDHSEIDLQIDKEVFRLVKGAYSSIRRDNQFQYNQGVLDRIRTLQKTDVILPVIITDDYAEATIPEDYVHSIRVLCLVSNSNARCYKLKCNKIEVDKTYRILSGSVIYNGIQYSKDETFIGVEGKDTYSIIPPEAEVAEIKSRRVPVRITESDILGDVLDNSLSATKASSPVAELTETSIRVYFSNFDVNFIPFSYIRKPDPVNFNFQRYSQGSILEVNTKYEVIKETISYNSTTYGLGTSFTTTSLTTFTGTGQVKKYLDGDLNLPIEVCYDVINGVVQELAIISEQNQQKIVNLAQRDNVPS